MIYELFYWVFNMSIASVICGFAVLLIRCIKRIPRKVIIFLWCIPFIRMSIPIGIKGKYGIMTLIAQYTTKTITVYEIGENVSFSMMNHVMSTDRYFPISYKTDLLENLFSVGSIIWIIVLIAFITIFSYIYFKTMKKVKGDNVHKRTIFFSENVFSPAVYGIFKPTIIIPKSYRGNNLKYILKHEYSHIKRHDNLFRIVALVLVCIHWFNPCCWIFLKLLYSDMELACDEAVLANCNEFQKKEYAHSLISAVEKNNVFVSGFGGSKIQLRIENILSFKKLSVFSIIAFSSIVISAFYILLTNAA